MPELLELAQLAQDDGVAQMDVRRRGVDAELHAQRPALRELALQTPPPGGRRRRCGVRNRAASPAESVMAPMLDCPARWAPVELVRARRASHAYSHPYASGKPSTGRPTSMQEPPTSITQPSPTPGPASSAPAATGRRRRRPQAAQAEAEEAEAGAGGDRPVGARADLDRLRDAHGRRERPALARQRGPVPGSPQLRALPARPRLPQARSGQLPADREADRQPQPHPGQRGRDLAQPQERGDRDRGPPLLQHHGVDYTGIARALSQDVLRRRAAQGGSTITQQFVKNALSAQNDRSVFQKLREAALAYHLDASGRRRRSSPSTSTPSTSVTAPTASRRRRHLLRRQRRADQPLTTPTTAGVTAAPPPISEEDSPIRTGATPRCYPRPMRPCSRE